MLPKKLNLFHSEAFFKPKAKQEVATQTTFKTFNSLVIYVAIQAVVPLELYQMFIMACLTQPLDVARRDLMRHLVALNMEIGYESTTQQNAE